MKGSPEDRLIFLISKNGSLATQAYMGIEIAIRLAGSRPAR